MAFASDSTTAPARPLLHLDRRAIGRDGWARARDLAAQLGGEIRDHVAAGMRQAWAAARGLLPAESIASTVSDHSTLASESTSAASASDRPAQTGSVSQPDIFRLPMNHTDVIGVVQPLLPAPAPLPSLTAALSRRRALFGAVAVVEPATIADVRRELEAPIGIAATNQPAPSRSVDQVGNSDAVPNYPSMVGVVADLGRTLYLRRQLAAAAEHGADLLASLGLPRLVTPGFAPLDRAVIGDALDNAINLLDALDGDPDLEPWLAGDPSPGRPLDVEDDSEEAEGTALESHGRGFVRCGEDDAEEDDPAEDSDPPERDDHHGCESEPDGWRYWPDAWEVQARVAHA